MNRVKSAVRVNKKLKVWAESVRPTKSMPHVKCVKLGIVQTVKPVNVKNVRLQVARAARKASAIAVAMQKVKPAKTVKVRLAASASELDQFDKTKLDAANCLALARRPGGNRMRWDSMY